MKLEHQLTPYTKINSRGIKDLNISHDTIKVLEENRGRKIDISCSNIFTDMSTRARDIKQRINKWDLIKMKSFCMAKENTIGREDGGEIGGSRVHFPSTPVKHLADLRSRVNSQQYSSIYGAHPD